MAKNTGHGSRIAQLDPMRHAFIDAKMQGGTFRGVRRLDLEQVLEAVGSASLVVLRALVFVPLLIVRLLSYLIAGAVILAVVAVAGLIIVGSIVLAIGYINAPASGTIAAKSYHEGTGTSCFNDSNGSPICSTDEDTWTFVLTDKNGNSGPVDVPESVYKSYRVGQQYSR